MQSRLTLSIVLAATIMTNSRVWAHADEQDAVIPSLNQIEGDQKDIPPSSLQGGVEQKDNAPLQGGVDTKVTTAPPLQGGVDTKVTTAPPLQGGVEQKATTAPPLQGGVEQKVAAPTLQPGVGKFASEPLRGAVDQTGRPPLKGSVQDSQRNALQGQVSDQGISLGARTPSYSAVMRIIQIKKTDAVPVAKPPPITEAEIQRARFRDNPDLDRAPVRADDTPQGRPIRGQTNGGAPRPVVSDGRPQRTALGVPQRSEPEGAPTRTLLSVDAPPIRPDGGWFTPPSRLPLDNQAPSSRVELNPMLFTRPADGANIAPGQDNSRILQPPPGRDIAAIPKRANPDGFQDVAKKKKRDKKTNLDVKPNAGAQAVPELAACADEMLLWDRWYQHVNDLVCAALRTTMPKHGNPAGTNRVHITVWADHRLEPRLVESNNPNFDQAIIEAYKSLNGSAELEFPKGTHRKQNDYETAHIQEIPAATAAFESRTVRGDLETLVK
ncbi:MAG: hypothetical protein EKK48_04145 [Candidatus Melainabacteria bacterium]|nr:MAG: hypothetical protein EKK48_04145 [Candidatus Melainabacteria bacterium]